MKQIVKRLRRSRGESLIESMAAILIVTLASVAFLTMVNTSARINNQTDAAEAEYTQEVEAAENSNNAAVHPGYQLKISFAESGTSVMDIRVPNVGIAKKSDEAVYAYYKLPD